MFVTMTDLNPSKTTWIPTRVLAAVCSRQMTAMYYIQRRGDGYLETVDEFEDAKEAKIMLAEYRMSDPYAHFYISSRACRAWRER